MAVVTRTGAYRERTLPQDIGQDGARDSLLHHQPQARCGAAEPGGSQALGHRKQTALGARRGFGEDLDRKRAGDAAENFAVLKRITLNMLKQEKSTQRGIKGKRLKAT